MIVTSGKVIDGKVVVEGVETMKQRRFLEELGCDEIQGFLVSQPVSAEKAADILRGKKPRRRKKTIKKKSRTEAPS